MRCPQCSHDDTKVLESRMHQDGRSIRRRRSCHECNFRFTTYEKEEDFVFQIQKRDGRVEAYQREKVVRSIQIACQKRPITIDQIDDLLFKLERHFQDDGERVVPSHKLGENILQALYNLDKVAYVRFASVYKDFKDPKEFVNELSAMNRER